jgi:outer membrane protein
MNRIIIIGLIYFFFSSLNSWSQENNKEAEWTIAELCKLADQKNRQVLLSQANQTVADQTIEIAKQQRLPSITSELNNAYLGNADVWSPSFRDHRVGRIPHQFTQLTIAASVPVFQGGKINNAVARARLNSRIASLEYEGTVNEIHFLIASLYLDINKFMNQQIVYANNIQLTEQKLGDILQLEKQGMVTQNDVLRIRLILSKYQLAATKIKNQIVIYNEQLNKHVGLEAEARLKSNTRYVATKLEECLQDTAVETDSNNNYEIRIKRLQSVVGQLNIAAEKGERWPTAYAYTGSTLQRPFLNTLPSVDIFYNTWRFGIGINYNLSGVYKSSAKIRSAKVSANYKVLQLQLTAQEICVNTRAARIRFSEARQELMIVKEDLKAAMENYRIVEKKYLNQLSLVTELVDATNIKIEAELNITNAEINVLNTYYQLLKITGRL